uniref:Uncharacterized protein n=1 Tax=Tetraodon nigroviridis TaxID=99883 RepID=H3D1K8_TETNG
MVTCLAVAALQTINTRWRCFPTIPSVLIVTGVTKTHNLRFQESEALQAVFAAHLCPNMLKCPARLLGDLVMHFPMSQDEITLSTSSQRVSVRNYCEDGKKHTKMMHTEASLHPDEFDHYELGVDSDLTFCLKELRGFAGLCRIPFSSPCRCILARLESLCASLWRTWSWRPAWFWPRLQTLRA